MNERLDQQPALLDLHRLNEVLHGFLMMFSTPPAAEEVDTSIDWEDGEISDQTEPQIRQ